MSKKPVKDVFGFWQLEGMGNADFSGKYDIPIVHGTSKIPESLVSFSCCEKERDTRNKSIHFYEFDEKFIGILDNKLKLDKKIETFRKYQSVILPDYSVYLDMPLAMQLFHVYKSRAIGNYLSQNGIKIIPNIRWGDDRTYEFAFTGVEKYGIIAVGVQGAYRDSDTRWYFEKGFVKMLEVLEPETVLCYGNLPKELIFEAEHRNTKIKLYPTEISKRTRPKNDGQLSLF